MGCQKYKEAKQQARTASYFQPQTPKTTLITDMNNLFAHNRALPQTSNPFPHPPDDPYEPILSNESIAFCLDPKNNPENPTENATTFTRNQKWAPDAGEKPKLLISVLM